MGFLNLDPNYEKRVFGLDLMRAIAIITVMIGHCSMLYKANTDFPWIKLIDGVELFFVLSGFLIGGILIRLLENNAIHSPRDIYNFWIRRWFRTLPNYYLILILNIIFVYFGLNNQDFASIDYKFFFFIQNFYTGFTGFFWESWSLSVEEWFYFFFPIILVLIISGLKSVLSKKHLFLISVLVFLLVPLALRAYYASRYDMDYSSLHINIYKVVIYRLDSIALGLLAAYCYRWHIQLWHRTRVVTFILGILICYFILYLQWLPNDISTKVFKPIVQSFGCMLLLPLFSAMKKAPRYVTKVVTHISLISYSMYLVNLGLVAEVLSTHFPPITPLSAWMWFVFYWLFVVLVSTLLFKYFERPMTRLRDKWSTG